jgi:hypothetical protein
MEQARLINIINRGKVLPPKQGIDAVLNDAAALTKRLDDIKKQKEWDAARLHGDSYRVRFGERGAKSLLPRVDKFTY